VGGVVGGQMGGQVGAEGPPMILGAGMTRQIAKG